MYNLRNYQIESVRVMKETKVGDPSLIVLPTAAGKTVCFAKLVSEVTGRVLIIVPSEELLEQSITKINNIDPNISIGRAQGKRNNLDARIVVGTWQSLSHKKSTRINTMLRDSGISYVVIDECHLAVSKIEKIISQLGDKVKIIGMTATPFNPHMKRVFKRISYSKPIIEMIMEGYLCEPQCYQIQSETDLNTVGITAGDFNDKELQITVNNKVRNDLIVKTYSEYASDRMSTIVFASGIQHIKDLVKEFTDAGIYCKGLDSKNKDKKYRKDTLAEFTSGKLPVLINVGILTTGFDYERLDCVILAKPTKSRILYQQCLGRGLRTHPDKENVLVLDICDNLRTHDLCDINKIFEMKFKQGETLKEAKERTEEEKRLAEEKKAAEELARQLIEQQLFEEQQRREEELKLQAHRIDLFNIGMMKAFAANEYDWFKIDTVTYCLSYGMGTHFIIENINNTYRLFNASTTKESKQINIIKSSDDINALIDHVDCQLVFNETSFVQKNAFWKKQVASDKQKYLAPDAKTKWEAHIHIAKKDVKKLLSNYRDIQLVASWN